jgi:nitrogen fixation NifU-like protein
LNLELRELYQELILEHNRNPRNFRSLEPPAVSANGYNPLCGDKVTVFVRVENRDIAEVSFQGNGCAISMASASMMTQALSGKSMEEARLVFKQFHELLTSGAAMDTERAGKLEVFSGVREFPMRVKCATLPWHTMMAAISGHKDTISTEN